MYLLIGDPHLTDRPRDAYRFGLFDWIRKQQAKYKPKHTIILGDLCDRKDKHSALLVNRVVDELRQLHDTLVLMGNHDYIDPNNPFFGFLNHLENVRFITKPLACDGMALLPHIRDEKQFKAACAAFEHRPDIVVLHNTFEGAIAESGAHLAGFSTTPVVALRARLGAFAGDVHRPQRAGPITYVGVPYTVRFGDDFDPRCLLVRSDGTTKDLHYGCPRKWALTITGPADLLSNDSLYDGDQVKISVRLTREEMPEWRTIRRAVLEACDKLRLEVFGVDLKVATPAAKKAVRIDKTSRKTDSEIITEYCKAEKAADAVRVAGLKFIEGQRVKED